MRDFNYRYLHWPPLANDYNITVKANQFYHCLEDIFFTQHVDFSTRNDAILDLVVSNEPNMINDVTD